MMRIERKWNQGFVGPGVVFPHCSLSERFYSSSDLSYEIYPILRQWKGRIHWISGIAFEQFVPKNSWKPNSYGHGKRDQNNGWCSPRLRSCISLDTPEQFSLPKRMGNQTSCHLNEQRQLLIARYEFKLSRKRWTKRNFFNMKRFSITRSIFQISICLYMCFYWIV